MDEKNRKLLEKVQNAPVRYAVTIGYDVGISHESLKPVKDLPLPFLKKIEAEIKKMKKRDLLSKRFVLELSSKRNARNEIKFKKRRGDESVANFFNAPFNQLVVIHSKGDADDDKKHVGIVCEIRKQNLSPPEPQRS